LCERHDPPVPKRSWRAAFNDSAMSIGTHVYKCHAVTVWDAVERVTGTDWKIIAPV